MLWRAFLVVLALVFSGAALAPAMADGVRVSPVAITFPAAAGSGSVRIDNGRATAVSFQIDVYRWTQVDGVDVLTPTRDVAVAPTVFEIAPGAGRIVRLALAPSQRGAQSEQSFRLIARELPQDAVSSGRSRVVLELSLPVFATVRGGAPQLDVRREHGAVHVSNNGLAHLRLLDMRGDPHAAAIERAPRYILAGSQFSRPLPSNPAALRFSFIAAGANETVQQTFQLTDPAALVARAR